METSHNTCTHLCVRLESNFFEPLKIIIMGEVFGIKFEEK
jgi:hypothetical protein